jgi:hypothetical protein
MSGSGFVLNPNAQEAEWMRCAEAVLMRLAPLLGPPRLGGRFRV